MKKLLSILLSVLMIVTCISLNVSMPVYAESTTSTIEFKDNGKSKDSGNEISNCDNVVSTSDALIAVGAEYVKSYTLAKVYNGKNGCGAKIGSNQSGNLGKIALTLKESKTISKVTVNAASYSKNDSANLKITVGTQSNTTALTTSFSDYSFDLTSQESTNAVSIETTSTGRAYIKSITLECSSTPTTVSVTGVTLNKTTATLTVGETETLTATVAPDDASDKSVTWSSDNESVATVSNGVVTAVAAGTANITVTTTDGSKTATYAVTVNSSSSTYNSDITVSWKEGYTPKVGDTVATVIDNLVISDSTNLNIAATIIYKKVGSDVTALDSTYTLVAGTEYFPYCLAGIKDEKKFAQTESKTYTGKVTVLGIEYTSGCQVATLEDNRLSCDPDDASNVVLVGSGDYPTFTASSSSTHTHDNLTFDTQLTSAGGALSAGNYYLNDDITLEKPIEINSGKVNICLNGHVLTAPTSPSETKKGAVYVNGGTLNIYDCDTTTVRKWSADSNGLWYADESGIKTTVGGVMTGNTSKVQYGFFCVKKGELNINKGNLVGNTTSATGGAIYAEGGTVNFKDGMIAGNTAPKGSGIILNKTNATLNISGGKIVENISTSENKGGVDIEHGNFSLSGNPYIRGNKANGVVDNVTLANGTIITDISEDFNGSVGITITNDEVKICDKKDIPEATINHLTPDKDCKIVAGTGEKSGYWYLKKTSSGETVVYATSISISKDSLSLAKGNTETLSVNYDPSDTTKTGVIWSTSDSGIATVSEGTVTAVGVGTATITAETVYGHITNTCTVTVTSSSKATPTASDLTYDSSTGTVSAASGKNLGTVTTYYKVNDSWTTTKPTTPGTYSVGVVVAGSDTYEAIGSATNPFTNNDAWKYVVVSVKGSDDNVVSEQDQAAAAAVVNNTYTQIVSFETFNGKEGSRAESTSIKNVLGDSGYINVDLISVAYDTKASGVNASSKITTFTFEVTAIKNGSEEHNLPSNVTFRLPVVVTGYIYANVYHEGSFIGQVEVKNNSYVEVSSKSFSEYSYTLTNTKYVTPSNNNNGGSGYSAPKTGIE